MALDERVLAVINAMYDAAVDDTRWPEALEQLTEVTGSQGASFWVLEMSTTTATTLINAANAIVTSLQ